MSYTPEELAERDTLRAKVERLRAAIDKAVDMLGDAATVSDVASVSEILETALAAKPESEAKP